MAKPIDLATRSRMMAACHSSGTRPEVAVRKALFARGFRYRVNDPRLPGRPDLAFARYRSAILVHGRFWHVHDCGAVQMPRTNPEFWAAKFDRNRARDARNVADLAARGWRVAIVWECAIDGRTSLGLDTVADTLAAWLREGGADVRPAARAFLAVRGDPSLPRPVPGRRRSGPPRTPLAFEPINAPETMRRVAETPLAYGAVAEPVTSVPDGTRPTAPDGDASKTTAS